LTLGGSVEFTYPCKDYVEANLWLTVSEDTGILMGGNATGGAAEASVVVKCDPPEGATWTWAEGTVLFGLEATAKYLKIGDLLTLEAGTVTSPHFGSTYDKVSEAMTELNELS